MMNLLKTTVITAMLFSGVSVAEEGIKFKRDDYANMQTHIMCHQLANKGGLDVKNLDAHKKNAVFFSNRYWTDQSSDKPLNKSELQQLFIAEERYNTGYIDGIIAATKGLDSVGINAYYLELCQSNKLFYIDKK